MKKAIIFHGTDCTPSSHWYPWLSKQLEARGYRVEVPFYTDMNYEPIKTFLPKVLQAQSFDSETILIGHSAGGPLILSVLESIEVIIPQVILVAGFSSPLPDGEENPILQSDYDWQKIKAHCKDIYFINSTNDPWGCDDKQGRYMFDRLGGTQIIRQEGHFGSDAFNQPYLEFPLLNSLVA